jgi:hypothetical protein
VNRAICPEDALLYRALAGPKSALSFGVLERATFKEFAQNGRGVERPAQSSGEFLYCLAARIRALWAFIELDPMNHSRQSSCWGTKATSRGVKACG